MEVIVKNRDILGGTPVFRGTRVPVQVLFDYLEGGETLEDCLARIGRRGARRSKTAFTRTSINARSDRRMYR
jgi:hypothetical protein